MKASCPIHGNDTTFWTSAHVVQTWEVDFEGNWMNTLEDCTDITYHPDSCNTWTCTKCGADATVTEN